MVCTVQQISQGSSTYLVGLIVVRDEFVKADDLAVEDCHAVKGLGHHAWRVFALLYLVIMSDVRNQVVLSEFGAR